VFISNFSLADQHKLELKERQPIAQLDLTPVTLGDDTSAINAETQMGREL
jgi:hypothetical protein